MTILYLLSAAALLVGTAAISMALLKPFPIAWLHRHYFVRKPVVWTIFAGSLAWAAGLWAAAGAFPWAAAVPLALTGLAVALTYHMHQESAFPAVDFPAMANAPLRLPLGDGMQLAVIEHGGVSKAYPLDYVVHHHIVNDRFGDRTVSLTYCAMCRSIIAYDVTDIGPLFVGSFKNANMVVADRRTGTFFQQATFKSVVGRLHPHTLTPIPFQILPWSEVRRLDPLPCVCQVSRDDFREFQLPVPGVWRKIMASEATPGLPARLRDKSFPARTHVVGVIDPTAAVQPAYLKRELLQKGVVRNHALDAFFVARGDTVNAFKGSVAGHSVELVVGAEGALSDARSATVWDARGKHKSGPIQADLEKLAISDEYWFSWKAFHPASVLIRLQ
ncbi:DUF3179 domain-containing protein [uncultured Ramlibacter sp.]|uniref:DUF3179 domain-containing protein n=1 Tax=uncultured Ramlibacter sp. TaxID=260755 RepID=UPI002602A202|nr:DUF3179 domain-containing protein [uncultured Ramlibacter sp.]